MVRIITPKGVLREVAEVVPVCETRLKFNGKQRRLVETAADLRTSAPTALAMRFQTRSSFPAGCVPSEELFVGNLTPEQTADIQKKLLTQGYFDFSVLVWQKAKELKDTVYDQGVSLPYTSDFVEDIWDSFFPSPCMGSGFPSPLSCSNDIFSQSPCPNDIFSQEDAGALKERDLGEEEYDDDSEA